MSPNFETKTAKIYQFPLNRRKGQTPSQHLGSGEKPADARHLPATEFGSGWYHQAAVQDALGPRKP